MRLVLIVYLLTVVLTLSSSVYLLIKLGLILFIADLLRNDLALMSPCAALKEIQFIGNEWVLVMKRGKNQIYTEVTILIHNELFQLIKFSNSNKNKLVVLFHDQITTDERRHLYFKIA